MLQHFHSMETFSHFEIFNYAGRRVVEGHKVRTPGAPTLQPSWWCCCRPHSVSRTTSARARTPTTTAQTTATRSAMYRLILVQRFLLSYYARYILKGQTNLSSSAKGQSRLFRGSKYKCYVLQTTMFLMGIFIKRRISIWWGWPVYTTNVDVYHVT